ncbi:MAG: protein serine/threonine phosphatase [Bacteroidetes bacterium]|nr:protein serine/threonine phosphatase [Bacteroidota bacterium]
MKRLSLIFVTLFLITTSVHAQKNVLDSLLSVLSKASTDSAKMDANTDVAWELANSDTKKAMQYALTALDIAKKLNSPEGLSNCYNTFGTIYENSSDYRNAIVYFNKAKDVVPEDKHVMANCLTNLGNVYSDLGNTEQAIINYLLALKQFELDHDEQGVGISSENIALVYDEQGAYAKARVYFNKSIAIELKYKDDAGLAGSYNNLGNTLRSQNKLDSAEIYYTKGLFLAQKTGHKRWESGCCEGLGMIAKEYKQYDEALAWFIKSLTIDRDFINDKQGMASSYSDMGDTYFLKGDIQKAIDMTNQAVTLSNEIKAYNIKIDCELALSKMYAADKQFDKAYQAHLEFVQLKDSLETKESAKHVAELQTKYESEKKETEIRVLTQENQIQDLQINKSQVIIYATIIGLVLLIILAVLIYTRYQLKRKANALLEFQNEQIQQQKKTIEVKNKDITDSIIYAKRIQEAILPPVEYIKEAFPDSFVLYKPKDIVSGDFYYFQKTNDGRIFLAAVDCTGHGVPGAFMSIVGFNALNQAINEYRLLQPGDVLNKMNRLLADTLHASDKEKSVQDGMDISLCLIDPQQKMLQFAGAFNSLWIVRNKELIEYKANKFPVGGSDAFEQTGEQVFTNNELSLTSGDCIYMFTDGYADQFGGPEGKKFKHKNLKELLLGIQDKNIKEQQQALTDKQEEWRGNLEQVDDILIIGVRIV